jgi:hypothetical protein
LIDETIAGDSVSEVFGAKSAGQPILFFVWTGIQHAFPDVDG